MTLRMARLTVSSEGALRSGGEVSGQLGERNGSRNTLEGGATQTILHNLVLERNDVVLDLLNSTSDGLAQD